MQLKRIHLEYPHIRILNLNIMENKIMRFHYEELVFALLILGSDLQDYDDDDLKIFAEAIHRLEVLSNPEFLKKLSVINEFINDGTILQIIDLHTDVEKIYSGQWYKKLRIKDSVIGNCSIMANQILKDLREKHINPIEYLENNMNID
jgi:hypothetical protein